MPRHIRGAGAALTAISLTRCFKQVNAWYQQMWPASAVALTVLENGILSTRTGTTSLLEIEFDGNRRKERVDFRPHLPFVFQL